MITKTNKRESRAAIIAVALFLFFDALALGLNFWLTARIESQAVGINLAGRQRMLSQRMVKVLLQMDNALKRDESIAHQLQELRITFSLFDETLSGFDKGHLTLDGQDKRVFLPAVQGEDSRALIEEAVRTWLPYRTKVSRVLEASPRDLLIALPLAVDHAEQNNLHLLGLMNRLTSELEQQTQHEASQIRHYQGAAFLLALINFFGAFWLYMRRVRAAHRTQDLLDEIINKIAASVVVLDAENRIIKANHTAEKLFDFNSGELSGRPLNELLFGQEGTLIGKRRDGSTFMASSQRNHANVEDQPLVIETISDVTRQRATEKHLSTLAYHDLLTQLPNRLLFDDRLHLEIAHAQRREQKLGIMFLDLDRFKPVNDQHGHDIGDMLLREVAHRLQDALRETDTVARRGGDEFTLLINDAGNHEAVGKVAQLIIELIGTPFTIAGIELSIGCSIGISLYPDDGSDGETLLAHADEAMYAAKAAGRATYRFYRDIAGRPQDNNGSLQSVRALRNGCKAGLDAQ